MKVTIRQQSQSRGVSVAKSSSKTLVGQFSGNTKPLKLTHVEANRKLNLKYLRLIKTPANFWVEISRIQLSLNLHAKIRRVLQA